MTNPVSWTFSGLTSTSGLLDVYMKKLSGSTASTFKPAFKSIRDTFAGRVEDVFRSEGAIVNGWQELSPMRIAQRDGQEHPILSYNWDLRAAAALGRGEEGAGVAGGEKVSSSIKYRKDSVVFSITGDKVYNQFGGVSRLPDGGWGILPARPFWPLGGRASRYQRQFDDDSARAFDAWIGTWFDGASGMYAFGNSRGNAARYSG
jgi:hypothetical protein